MSTGAAGSEPRRWVLTADGVDLGPEIRVGEVVTVQEVGSGHDEQTEAHYTVNVCRKHQQPWDVEGVCGCEAAEGLDSVLVRAVPFYPTEWQPDPRTVAAVVEALREQPPNMLASGPAFADLVENHPRFGSSVSGGE